MEEKIKCTLCGYEFNPEETLSSCKGCFLSKQCQRIKCLNCGFGTIPEAKQLKQLQNKRRQKNESNR